MGKILLYLFVLIALSCWLPAQKEANNWYFGKNAGITFNFGQPRALTDGAMNTLEGCASISDRNGKLLFYTDGVSIWNNQHSIMPGGTGLLGDGSSTQSAVVVPDPGSVNQYYVFTVASGGSDTGVRYSVVDISKNGGLGQVTQKNIFLYGPSTEKLTAVRHGNGHAVWMVSHEWNSDRFRSYLVDETGVVPVPVISRAGSVHTRQGNNSQNTLGYLKASHDGKRLALALFNSAIIEIFDFNSQDGSVSNPVSIPKDSSLVGIYGIEFSPDAKRLYASCWNYDSSFVYQFNITGTDALEIKNSCKIVASYPKTEHYYALQSGPDGRLYIAVNKGTYLSVINNPDNEGASCNFTETGVDLAGRQSMLGLPDFIQSFFFRVSIYSNNPVCEGETLNLSASDITGARYRWSGPNGFSSDEQNTSIPNANKSMSGTYTLEISDSAGVISVSTVEIIVRNVNLGFSLPSGLDMGHACLRNSTSKSLSIKNEGSDEGFVSAVYIKSGSDVYTIEPQLNPPLRLLPGESYSFNVIFSPVDSVTYPDSIIVETNKPCLRSFSLPLTGSGLATKTIVWLPDTTALIGQQNFCLPFRAKLGCLDGILPGMAFRAELAFDATVFLPYEQQASVTSSRVVDGIRLLTLEGSNLVLDNDGILLADLCGTVLLGDALSIPLEIRSFAWSDSLIDAHTENGSISTGAVCQSRLRLINVFEPLRLEISPNPAGEKAQVILSGDYTGEIELYVYSCQGLLKLRSAFRKDGQAVAYDIDINDLPSGVYQVIALCDGSYESKPMVVVK